MSTRAAVAVTGLPTLRALRLGGLSIRYAPRVLVVGTALTALLFLLMLATLMSGRLGLGPAEVWAALNGEGSASAVRSIRGRRLPRLLTAIGVGGCLGVSGTMFQSLSRNVLGSPDIIGFTTGAAVGATVQILLLGGGMAATAFAAVAGGVLTALVVYVLSRRDGSSGGLRLVLVGVGMGALLSAVIDLLMVRAAVTDAAVVQQWSAGSLTGRGWTHALIVLAVSAVMLPALIAIGRQISVMEMGDDIATALGIRVERQRFLAVVLSVVLVGVATAAAGPIAFIALAAPQIARRISRGTGVLASLSFLTGAVLLTGADLLTQSVEIGLRTPVGLVTSFLGGLYLIYLLARRV